jgi:uncharacterized membrane protein
MPASRRLLVLLRLTSLLLGVQLILGVYVALAGREPSTSNLMTALSYTGDPALTAHYAIAAILILLGLVVLVVAFRKGEPRSAAVLALVGFVFVLLASEAGLQFLASGFSSNAWSLTMAVGFVLAIAFYGLAQRAARRSATPVPA